MSSGSRVPVQSVTMPVPSARRGGDRRRRGGARRRRGARVGVGHVVGARRPRPCAAARVPRRSLGAVRIRSGSDGPPASARLNCIASRPVGAHGVERRLERRAAKVRAKMPSSRHIGPATSASATASPRLRPSARSRPAPASRRARRRRRRRAAARRRGPCRRSPRPGGGRNRRRRPAGGGSCGRRSEKHSTSAARRYQGWKVRASDGAVLAVDVEALEPVHPDGDREVEVADGCRRRTRRSRTSSGRRTSRRAARGRRRSRPHRKRAVSTRWLPWPSR